MVHTATTGAGIGSPNSGRRTGGQVLVDQLLLHGADTAFCVPGESYLAVLDALHDVCDRIALINARHEAGAAQMAEAYGQLTGRPGIALVTRGPGACHAAVGIHTAAQDSTPMILLIGQVSRQTLDREAFQEIDYRAMFAPLTKWAAQIERADRIPEYLARAFQTATSGRPGPVVLSLPEDVLTEVVHVPDARPYLRVKAEPSPHHLEVLRQRLEQAERPLVIVGGSCWPDEACADLRAFAEANELPVATSFRRQDLMDHRSPSFVGDLGMSGPPSLQQRCREADLILAIGTRLSEFVTQGYTLLDVPVPRQRLIHVHADANELGRVYIPDLAIAADPGTFAAALPSAPWFDPGRWGAWREEARAAYLESLEVPESGYDLDPGVVMRQLETVLPEDAIVTLDAGNHAGWPQRFLRYGRPGRQVGSTCGAMGFGVPAAVAASLRFPDRVVVGMVGDGGFMMSGQELCTAVQHGAKPIVLLFDNGMYGTIRMHQERHHPGRVIGTTLVNPDFVSLGTAMGAHAEVVDRTDSFLPAWHRALGTDRPALLVLRTDPELITTRQRLSSLGRGTADG